MALTNSFSMSHQTRGNYSDISDGIEPIMNGVPMTAEDIMEYTAKTQAKLYKDFDENIPAELAWSSRETSFHDDQSIACDVQKAVSSVNYQNTIPISKEDNVLLLDVRTREVQKLNDEVESLKIKNERDREILLREINDLTTEKVERESALDDCNRLLITKHETINQLSDKCTAIERQLTMKNEEFEKLEGSYYITTLTIKDLQNKVTLMEKDSRNTVETIRLEKQIKDKDEKHRREVAKLQEELQMIFKKLNHSEMENGEISKKLRQAAAVNTEMLNQKTELINRLSSEIEVLKEQLATASPVDLQVELRSLRRREADLESELSEVRRRCETQADEITLLRVGQVAPNGGGAVHADVSRMCSDNKSLRAEVNNLQERLLDKERIEQTLRDETVTLKRYLIDKDQQLDRLKARSDVSLSDDQKITEMREENESLRQRLLGLEEENKGLQHQLANQMDQHSLDRYNEQYLKFHDEALNNLRKELDDAYMMQSKAKDERMEELKAEIEKVKNAYLMLKETQKDTCNSPSILVDLQTLRNENLSQKSTMQKDKEDLELVTDEKNKFSDICESLKTKVSESERKFRELKNEYSKKEQMFDKMVEEMNIVKEEKEVYERNYNDLKSGKVESVDVQKLKDDLESSRIRMLQLSKTHSEHCLQGKEEREKKIADLIEENLRLQKELKTIVAERSILLTRVDNSNSVDLQLKVSQLEEIIAKKDISYKKFEEITKRKYAEYAALLEALAVRHEEELQAAQMYIERMQRKSCVDAGTITDRQECVTEPVSKLNAESDLILATTKAHYERVLQDLHNKLIIAENKYADLKTKTRRYKAYFNDAFLRLEKHTERDRENYVQVLSGLLREIQLIPRHLDGHEAWRKLEPVTRLYEEKMDQLLKDFQRKQPK